MRWENLETQVLPSLLAGTSRRPLEMESTRVQDASSDRTLAMLALTGQALRFRPPATPASFLTEPEIKDERRILPEVLRRPLVRLLTAKNTTEHPARALARAFDRLRLRPHPFDMPAIDGFVRNNAERLGPTAQHWVDRQKQDSEIRSYFDPELLNESNWSQSTRARAAAYLEQRRTEEPETARALLESVWSQQDAESRFRFLQVLQVRLSPSDQAFLSTLEKDRAPRVRGLAARFLARLGAGGDNPAVAGCLERIKQSESGLLKKRKLLQLELPANVKDQGAARWVRETFSEISMDELASALHLTSDQLIESASKDEPLLLALALMATNDRSFDLLELVTEHLPNTWERIFESGLDALPAMSGQERQRWEQILVQPYRKELPAVYAQWDWLARLTDTEAPEAMMSFMLESKLLAKLHDSERIGAQWFELMAAMCPPVHRSELRMQLKQFDPSMTVTPLALLDILDAMENRTSHA